MTKMNLSDGELIFKLEPGACMAAERHYVTLRFFNGDTQVAKSEMAGVVNVYFSEDDFDYGLAIEGSVELGTDTYNRPRVAGSYSTCKVDLSNVTGTATECVIEVFSHG